MELVSARQIGRQVNAIIAALLLGLLIADAMVEGAVAIGHGQRGEAIADAIVILVAALVLARLWRRWRYPRDLDPVDASPIMIMTPGLYLCWLVLWRPLMRLLSLLWGALVLVVGFAALAVIWVLQQIPTRRPAPLPGNVSVVDFRSGRGRS
jgi:hypothetical protein